MQSAMGKFNKTLVFVGWDVGAERGESKGNEKNFVM